MSPFTTQTTEPISESTSTDSPVLRNARTPHALSVTPDAFPSLITMREVLKDAAERMGGARAMGQRPLVDIITEEKTITKNGQEEVKKWKFFHMGKYEWWTYNEVREKALTIGKGLLEVGMKPKDRVAIFNSTGREWLTFAHGAFTQNITIVTVYDTLGPEGLSHALREGDTTHLYTNVELLPNVNKILGEVPSLTHVIYNGAKTEQVYSDFKKQHPKIELIHLDDLMVKGTQCKAEETIPVPDDIACIMYTSGTTGNPKGVVLTHKNLSAVIGGLYPLLKPYLGYPAGHKADIYLAFLPTAHVLEFAIETYCMFSGVALGYGSIRTLTDTNCRNCVGDLKELRPTLMAGVPAVWENIRKAVMSKLDGAGPIARFVFDTAFRIRRKAIEMGYFGYLPTDFIFNKIRDTVGGRLRFTLSGGAPVAQETHQFMTVTTCPMIQGYGSTETCGMACLLLPDHFGWSRVGELVTCTEVKLVNATDAGYLYTNEPRPQGELYIRGPSVTKGYFKNEQVTKESFTDDGWFITGDIAQLNEDGTLSIIDRKKNLVKLSNGEYIALEKIESTYKTDKHVMTMIVHANPNKDAPVAIVVGVWKEILELAKSIKIENIPVDVHGLDDMAPILNDPALQDAVLKSLQATAKKGGLRGTEIINKVHLTEKEWTSDNGFLTAASKVMRRNVMKEWGKHVE